MIDLGDVDHNLTIVLLGSVNTGKSSMMSMYCRGDYPVQYRKTIAASFSEKTIESLGEEVHLMIWDLPGEHVFSPMNHRHFKSADAVIMMFATDDLESFHAITTIHDKVQEMCGRKTTMVLVQNKVDLLDRAQMNAKQVEDLATALGVKLYRTCCKEYVNVAPVFEHLVSKQSGNSSSAIVDIGDVVPVLKTAIDGIKIADKIETNSPSKTVENQTKVPVFPTAMEEPNVAVRFLVFYCILLIFLDGSFQTTSDTEAKEKLCNSLISFFENRPYFSNCFQLSMS